MQHLAVVAANELLLILAVQVDAGLAKGAEVEGDVAQVAKVVMGRQLRCQKGNALYNLIVRHPSILWQSGGVLSCAHAYTYQLALCFLHFYRQHRGRALLAKPIYCAGDVCQFAVIKMGKGFKDGVGNKGNLVAGAAKARNAHKAAKRHIKATEARKRNKCSS